MNGSVILFGKYHYKCTREVPYSQIVQVLLFNAINTHDFKNNSKLSEMVQLFD